MRKMLTLAITLFMASAAPRLAAADDETYSAIEPGTDPDPAPDPAPTPSPSPDPEPNQIDTDHFHVYQTGDDQHGSEVHWND
ncbi:MAG TPA: hypothetical protein VL463_27685 [Kofleriaceae bacterium]|jgi:hypothetical protein|nr:hypothetical protein [Kofleriaceae bacterium]